jgi:hypothetical protein
MQRQITLHVLLPWLMKRLPQLLHRWHWAGNNTCRLLPWKFPRQILQQNKQHKSVNTLLNIYSTAARKGINLQATL